MGSGKVIKCKKCGCEISIFKGVGFENKPIQANDDPICPECGSKEFEDTGTIIMWD